MANECSTLLHTSPPTPLISVGMQYVHDSSPTLSEEDQHTLESTSSQFLSNVLTFKECSQIFLRIIGTKKPLTKVLAIIQTPEQPIPNSLQFGHPISHGINNILNNSNFKSITSIANKSRHWTNYEDRRLLAGIHRYGIGNWISVANFVGNGRSKSQCWQRWARGLNPEIKKDKWMPEEETLLLQLVNSGDCKSWTSIASKMKNRSDVQCRYHYKQMTGNETLKEEFHNIENPKISMSISQPAVFLTNQKIVLPSIREFLNDTGNHSTVKFSRSSGCLAPIQVPVQVSDTVGDAASLTMKI